MKQRRRIYDRKNIGGLEGEVIQFFRSNVERFSIPIPIEEDVDEKIKKEKKQKKKDKKKRKKREAKLKEKEDAKGIKISYEVEE